MTATFRPKPGLGGALYPSLATVPGSDTFPHASSLRDVAVAVAGGATLDVGALMAASGEFTLTDFEQIWTLRAAIKYGGDAYPIEEV